MAANTACPKLLKDTMDINAKSTIVPKIANKMKNFVSSWTRMAVQLENFVYKSILTDVGTNVQ